MLNGDVRGTGLTGVAIEYVGEGHKGHEHNHRQGSDADPCDLLDQECEFGVHRGPFVEVDVLIIWPAH